jgi:hypothetical protein
MWCSTSSTVSAQAVTDVADQPAERADLVVVQAGGRLVEEQQLRIAGQRARQLDPLLQRKRQRSDRSLGKRIEADEAHQIAGALGGRSLLDRDRARAAVHWPESARRAAVPPTITLSRTLIVREQRDVLERAADAEGGHADVADC